MLRLGLCCLFKEAPIKFRQTTIAFLKRKFPSKKERLAFLTTLALDNLVALEKALLFCAKHHIGAFRVVSQLFPCFTHSEVGYTLEEIKGAKEGLKKCGALAKKHNIRLSFHPDQFVVLNSPKQEIVESSMKELMYHLEMATLLGADVINIHAGGVYGDKSAAINRLENTLKTLPLPLKKRLTLENDDKSYTPKDLYPLCKKWHIPLCYDVHHHRCLKDGWTIEEATKKALETWEREPLFHLSSPLHGWKGATPERHHDYINPKDFPPNWLTLSPLTVDIEAKAKELAVLKLQKALQK